MRNIFLSVVIVAALVVAGIGGTLADWTEDDSGDYCFSAGYLNLRVDKGQMDDPNNPGEFLPVWFMQTTAGIDYLPLGIPDGVDDPYYADELGSIICIDNMMTARKPSVCTYRVMRLS